MYRSKCSLHIAKVTYAAPAGLHRRNDPPIHDREQHTADREHRPVDREHRPVDLERRPVDREHRPVDREVRLDTIRQPGHDAIIPPRQNRREEPPRLGGLPPVIDSPPHGRERHPSVHHAIDRDVRPAQEIARPPGHDPIIPPRVIRREEPPHMGGLPPATDAPRPGGGIRRRREPTGTEDPPEIYLPRHQDDRMDVQSGRRLVTRDGQYRPDNFNDGESYSCSDCEASESVL